MVDPGRSWFATLASVLLLTTILLASITMSNRLDAPSKDAEGKLKSAYGDLTGDTGHQAKGKAKQMQASAMNAAEDLKEGAKSVAKKVADAASDLADKID
jgi:uncharacterized protein YjbJ (UPF0337 family)